jgi:anti-sigma factor RsiW
MHDSALHLTEDELHDAADGTSAPTDGSRTARHLAHCARCRADVDRIRSLLSMAAALPRSVEPPADLWPEIRSRIHGASSGPAATRRWNAMMIDRRWLAAAAVLLIVASSALTALFMRQDTDGFARGPDSSGPGVVSPVARTVSDDYDRLDRELASMLAAQRDKLQPETVAKVEHNLAIIDQAIREIRDALAVDPGNEALLQLLKASYGQKSALVRQVSAS